MGVGDVDHELHTKHSQSGKCSNSMRYSGNMEAFSYKTYSRWSTHPPSAFVKATTEWVFAGGMRLSGHMCSW